ncbi:hypothetical protein QBC38DRAFT_121155 [Podospora fimiseda]|uniref:Rhodopsin domain-containing protein n=1 Tax=Podospora fimiseda TaxID=252190 RepID=A0AAN6YNA2_9PEZI|nr:hypothetical protein QBC38DRAFT_121155 [Podospora fimiseda]
MVSMSIGGFLALGVMLISLTGILVIVRVAFNIRQAHKFFLEDALAVSALCFLVSKFGLLYTAAIEATHSRTPTPRYLQLDIGYHWMGAAAMWTSKASILFLLIRLFGAKNWLRVTYLIAIFTSLILFLACVIITAVSCTPVSLSYKPKFLHTCIDRANTTSIIRGGVAVSLDFIILILPIPIIYNLSLSISRKIGLFFIFSAVSFSLGTGIASLYFKISGGGSSSTWPSRIGTTIDCSVAIMVGCVPALYGAWCSYITKSTPYSKARSAISSFSNTVWRQFHRSSVSQTRKSNNSSHHQYSNRTDSYYSYRIWADNGGPGTAGIELGPQSRRWERLPD